MLNNKKILILIACGVVAVVLICILLVGIINGQWPWQNGNMDGTYTGLATSGEEETTGEAQDVTTSDTVDPTETTGDAEDAEGTKPASGEDSGNKPQNPTQPSNPQNPSKPTNPQDPTIGVEVEDPTQPAGSDDPTQTTESDKPGDQPSNEINFDDLISAAL